MTETETPTRRRHERIPGEATILGLLPTGYTLLGVIAAGIFYAAISYTQIYSNAADIEKMQEHLERQTRALNGLSTNQKLLSQKVETFIQAQDERDKQRDVNDQATSATLREMLRELKR